MKQSYCPSSASDLSDIANFVHIEFTFWSFGVFLIYDIYCNCILLYVKLCTLSFPIYYLSYLCISVSHQQHTTAMLKNMNIFKKNFHVGQDITPIRGDEPSVRLELAGSISTLSTVLVVEWLSSTVLTYITLDMTVFVYDVTGGTVIETATMGSMSLVRSNLVMKGNERSVFKWYYSTRIFKRSVPFI